jgi:hypothetical protein
MAVPSGPVNGLQNSISPDMATDAGSVALTKATSDAANLVVSFMGIPPSKCKSVGPSSAPVVTILI